MFSDWEEVRRKEKRFGGGINAYLPILIQELRRAPCRLSSHRDSWLSFPHSRIDGEQAEVQRLNEDEQMS